LISLQCRFKRKTYFSKGYGAKGEDEGGGGGVEFGGVDQIRKDFRVLAFYVGSAITDKNGYYEGEFNLPETLSTFRIMAVAHTRIISLERVKRNF